MWFWTTLIDFGCNPSLSTGIRCPSCKICCLFEGPQINRNLRIDSTHSTRKYCAYCLESETDPCRQRRPKSHDEPFQTQTLEVTIPSNSVLFGRNRDFGHPLFCPLLLRQKDTNETVYEQLSDRKMGEEAYEAYGNSSTVVWSLSDLPLALCFVAYVFDFLFA